MRTKSLANAATDVMIGAALGGILLATVGHSSGHNVLLVLVPMVLTVALLLALGIRRDDESSRQRPPARGLAAAGGIASTR